MSGRRAWCLLALALCGAARAEGQEIRHELGLQGIVLAGEATSVGGGGYWAVRPSARARISLFAGGGRVDGRGFGRGEVLAHFLLAPAKRRGVEPYLAGGLALDHATRTDLRIVALLGIEGRPGARRGWIVEGGVGGGWRFAAGWRWRH